VIAVLAAQLPLITRQQKPVRQKRVLSQIAGMTRRAMLYEISGRGAKDAIDRYDLAGNQAE
jgi:hypothetical protein